MGSFNNEELHKTIFWDNYQVKKFLKRNGDRVYVEWLGFEDTHVDFCLGNTLLVVVWWADLASTPSEAQGPLLLHFANINTVNHRDMESESWRNIGELEYVNETGK